MKFAIVALLGTTSAMRLNARYPMPATGCPTGGAIIEVNGQCVPNTDLPGTATAGTATAGTATTGGCPAGMELVGTACEPYPATGTAGTATTGGCPAGMELVGTACEPIPGTAPPTAPPGAMCPSGMERVGTACEPIPGTAPPTAPPGTACPSGMYREQGTACVPIPAGGPAAAPATAPPTNSTVPASGGAPAYCTTGPTAAPPATACPAAGEQWIWDASCSWVCESPPVYHPPTRAEQIQDFAQGFFSQCDINQNGFMNRKELGQCLKKMNKMMRQSAKDMLQQQRQQMNAQNQWQAKHYKELGLMIFNGAAPTAGADANKIDISGVTRYLNANWDAVNNFMNQQMPQPSYGPYPSGPGNSTTTA